jgi:hypothetical protein
MLLAVATTFWESYGVASPPVAAFVVNEARSEFAAPARLAHNINSAMWSLACLTMLVATPLGFLRPLFLVPALIHGLLAVSFPPGRGMRRLTAGGLLPGRGFRRASTPIPWEEIVGAAAEAPTVSILGRRSVFGVTIVWPGRAKPLHFQWTSLDIDVRLMADAIEYYRAHPEHRVAIGTVAEHRRLYATLAQQYVQAGRRPIA